MKCIIQIKKDKNIIKAFKDEKKHSRRSDYEIKELKNHINFVVKAKDYVAMRATVNTILRLLDVYQKGKNGDTQIRSREDKKNTAV